MGPYLPPKAAHALNNAVGLRSPPVPTPSCHSLLPCPAKKHDPQIRKPCDPFFVQAQRACLLSLSRETPPPQIQQPGDSFFVQARAAAARSGRCAAGPGDDDRGADQGHPGSDRPAWGSRCHQQVHGRTRIVTPPQDTPIGAGARDPDSSHHPCGFLWCVADDCWRGS